MITRALRLCPLLLVPLTAGWSVAATHHDNEPQFANPVLLTGGAKPLGRGLLYPSPALFDIDGDGALEIVMGDLFGKLYVAEKLAGDDPLAWSARTPLKDKEGKDIKFSNW